jgi:hypothetical protein
VTSSPLSSLTEDGHEADDREAEQAGTQYVEAAGRRPGRWRHRDDHQSQGKGHGKRAEPEGSPVAEGLADDAGDRVAQGEAGAACDRQRRDGPAGCTDPSTTTASAISTAWR